VSGKGYANLLMLRYISPYPNATNNAYDSEGFFRTGDLGRIEDDVVYLLGRASQDGIEYLVIFNKFAIPSARELTDLK
jgi:acyl-CoA synthetase (AMP-forming)/AMP-acid ligase II